MTTDDVINNKLAKTYVVMPAYNAEATLVSTFELLPRMLQKNTILVDDFSIDRTADIAKSQGILTISHSKNLGYGANQKTCYKKALELGAEIVIMVHPDNQYDPRVTLIMAELIALNNADIVLGNRIRTRREALSGGMPKWRYFLNRLSTLIENLLLGQTIGDFHSGMRAYSRDVLLTIPFEKNSNAFKFDQELLIQAAYFNFRIADIPIPAKYNDLSSSISIKNSIYYGLGGFLTILSYFAHKLKIKNDPRFRNKKEMFVNEN